MKLGKYVGNNIKVETKVDTRLNAEGLQDIIFGKEVNQEGLLDTIKSWFSKQEEKPEEVTYTLGVRDKAGLLTKKDFSKAYCFPADNLFPYIYNFLFKQPSDVKKYVMAVANNLNNLLALTNKPGIVEPLKVTKALKDVNQFLSNPKLQKSTNENIIYSLGYIDLDTKQKQLDIDTAAMEIKFKVNNDSKYPIIYLEAEYAQKVDRLEMKLNPEWLSQYSNYLDPSVVKTLVNDYKQYKGTYLKLDKKIPEEVSKDYIYKLPEVYQKVSDLIDDNSWNDELVSAMGRMVDAIEFIEDMVDAIAELSVVDDGSVQELITEHNLKKA